MTTLVHNVDMSEKWKSIKGYEGLYLVSDMGRVKSLDRVTRNGHPYKGRVLIPQKSHKYLRVCLCDSESNKRLRSIHRIVAETFIGESDLQVDHIDGNTKNNRLSNLQYLSPMENTKKFIKEKYGELKTVGVYFSKARNRWISNIRHKGNRYILGEFPEKTRAIKARLCAEREIIEHNKVLSFRRVG